MPSNNFIKRILIKNLRNRNLYTCLNLFRRWKLMKIAFLSNYLQHPQAMIKFNHAVKLVNISQHPKNQYLSSFPLFSENFAACTAFVCANVPFFQPKTLQPTVVEVPNLDDAPKGVFCRSECICLIFAKASRPKWVNYLDKNGNSGFLFRLFRSLTRVYVARGYTFMMLC